MLHNIIVAGGEMGVGWTHSLNWFLLEMTNATYRGESGDFWLILSPGDDSLHWFKRNTNGRASGPALDN